MARKPANVKNTLNTALTKQQESSNNANKNVDTVVFNTNNAEQENININNDSESANVQYEDMKPKVKLEAEISIEPAAENVMKRKDAVLSMNADTAVVVDNKETYFERLAKKQAKESENSKNTYAENLRPEIIEDTTEISQRFSEPKSKGKFESTIVPSEQLKPISELEEGMCQYYVTALYILDSANGLKYLQGSIITLPSDVEKMPRLFSTCFNSGRLLRCEDMQKKVNRQKQMYDSRCRRWVKEGTAEYDEYKKYLEEKQAKIAASNERKIQQERKRLGLEEK